MWMELAGFAGIMALGQMTPGPDWILVTRGALSHGFRAAVWTATGIACGLMVHAAVAVGGLAVYVRRSEAAWDVMRWLAGGYLLWVAFSILREGGRARPPETSDTGSRRPFVRGLATNLLNAKVCLFLAAVCASYLQGERPVYWPMVLWGVIVIQGWVLWIVWAALLRGRYVRRVYGRFQRWLDAGFATGLLLLGLKLFAGGR